LPGVVEHLGKALQGLFTLFTSASIFANEYSKHTQF
jgi:hypothetical protein